VKRKCGVDQTTGDFTDFYRQFRAGCFRDFPGGLDAGAVVDGDTMVFAALRALPVRQREVVALRILLDLDVDTTADTLGIAPGTVKAHLHRALATMRTRLAPFPEKGQQYDSAH
jgi:hypothetical protein